MNSSRRIVREWRLLSVNGGIRETSYNFRNELHVSFTDKLSPMKKLIFVFAGMALFTISRADSPLTSTPFYTAYNEIIAVNKASEGKFDKEVLAFLDGANPIDQKIAVANALSWGKMENVTTYVSHLKTKYKLDQSFFDSVFVYRGEEPPMWPGMEKLNSDEMLCLGYMNAMADYFNPLNGHTLIYHSFIKEKTRTHAIVLGLIISQYSMDYDWCMVYQVMAAVREDESITMENFREEAMNIIFEYIDGYSSSCYEEEEEAEEFSLIQEPVYYNQPEKKQENKGKKNHADLVIEKIMVPDYVDEISGTRVLVIVKNKGTVASIETNSKMTDIDMTRAEAAAEGLKGYELDYADESYYEKDPAANDRYFESWSVVPALAPGELYVLEFKVYNYWIFDPNCEIKVILDFDENIIEPDEKNNKKVFVMGG